MASAPATPEQLRPNVRRGDAQPVTVTYYRGTARVGFQHAGGWGSEEFHHCEHLHVTLAAADECGARLARKVGREALEAFVPCGCHGCSPSVHCAEHPEPLRFWAPDA